MKPVSRMSRLELAAFIAAEFHRRKINVVLSGGSCVSIYSVEKYVDVDVGEIARWSAVEGKQEAFDGIKQRLTEGAAQQNKSSVPGHRAVRGQARARPGAGHIPKAGSAP